MEKILEEILVVLTKIEANTSDTNERVADCESKLDSIFTLLLEDHGGFFRDMIRNLEHIEEHTRNLA